MTAKDLMAHLRFQLHQHGWPAWLGLALVVAAAGLHFFGVEPANERAAALRAQQSSLRANLAVKAPVVETSEQKAAAFYGGLPVTGALETVDAIHRAAAKHGVKVTTGEYRLLREGGARVVRYQITLPARASYPRLRNWLADVMSLAPSLALDEVNFRREDAGQDAVDARVRFTFLMRAS